MHANARVKNYTRVFCVEIRHIAHNSVAIYARVSAAMPVACTVEYNLDISTENLPIFFPRIKKYDN